jgi:hypothetical protein
MPTVLEERLLTREATLRLLARLETGGGNTGAVCFQPELASADKEPLLSGLPPGVAELAIASKTGAGIFREGQSVYVVLPPFPIQAERRSFEGVALTLHKLLEPEYRIALVLVRLGYYAIGLSHGEKLAISKVGTGLVHGRHRQGGSSAARFRRHREKQIETYLTRVCGHLRECLEPEARGLDYIIYGGAETTLHLLEKQCDFLKMLHGRVLPPLLTIPNPNRAVLEDSVRRLFLSRVIELRETA